MRQQGREALEGDGGEVGEDRFQTAEIRADGSKVSEEAGSETPMQSEMLQAGAGVCEWDEHCRSGLSGFRLFHVTADDKGKCDGEVGDAAEGWASVGDKRSKLCCEFGVPCSAQQIANRGWGLHYEQIDSDSQ